jgi:hypothetical protein
MLGPHDQRDVTATGALSIKPTGRVYRQLQSRSAREDAGSVMPSMRTVLPSWQIEHPMVREAVNRNPCRGKAGGDADLRCSQSYQDSLFRSRQPERRGAWRAIFLPASSPNAPPRSP